MFLLLLMVVVAQGSIWSSLAGVNNEKIKSMEKVVGGRKKFTQARGMWAWHCWVMIPNRFSESWFHKARVCLQEIRLH